MTSKLRVRLAKLATLLGAVSLVWACNAPPIVVPPPAAVAVSFSSQLVTDASGQQQTVWTSAQPQPFPPAASARFSIFDVTLGTGVIQTAAADGTFATTPAWVGSANDHISIYYETPAGDYSESICLLLAEGPSVACPP